MKIQITKPALQDLEDIEFFIRQDKPQAAINTVLKIIESLEYLADSPHMGRLGRVPNTLELVINGTLFIGVYQIRQFDIMILRILHAARKWPSQF